MPGGYVVDLAGPYCGDGPETDPGHFLYRQAQVL